MPVSRQRQRLRATSRNELHVHERGLQGLPDLPLRRQINPITVRVGAYCHLYRRAPSATAEESVLGSVASTGHPSQWSRDIALSVDFAAPVHSNAVFRMLTQSPDMCLHEARAALHACGRALPLMRAPWKVHHAVPTMGWCSLTRRPSVSARRHRPGSSRGTSIAGWPAIDEHVASVRNRRDLCCRRKVASKTHRRTLYFWRLPSKVFEFRRRRRRRAGDSCM